MTKNSQLIPNTRTDDSAISKTCHKNVCLNLRRVDKKQKREMKGIAANSQDASPGTSEAFRCSSNTHTHTHP